MAKRINVVGAVIVSDGLVLAARRAPGAALAGCWEFPGGKIEPGETARAALVREIREELRCAVDVADQIESTDYAYEFGTVTLTTYWCELRAGEPTLTDHDEVRWLKPEDLQTLQWAPADVPAVNAVKERMSIRADVE